MFTSFTTALSGLNAMTNAIDVVGNNLANLNTTGYKNHNVSFSQLVAQALDGTSDTQVGLGVSRPTTVAQFSQGSIQTTSGQYDAAIDGNGFFVVKGAANQTLYTRDGSFNQDKNGFLVTLGGQRVQGWMAVNGVVNTNGSLSDIQVPVGQTLQAQATTKFSMAANLDSSATPTFSTNIVGTAPAAPFAITTGVNDKFNLVVNGTTYNLTLANTDTTPTLAATDIQTQLTAAGSSATVAVNGNGDLQVTSGGTGASAYVQVLAGTANTALGLATTSTANPPNLTTTIDAIDSLGNTVPVNVNFTKMTPGGRWQYSISPAAGSLAPGATMPVTSGIIDFNSSGTITSVSNAVNGVVTLNTINNLADGASALNLNWNLLSANGAPLLTQYDETSAVASKSLDGQSPAELSSVSIGDGGLILATYSDGNQVLAGQLALANIGNPQSLIGVADNNYSLSAATASPTIGASGTGGRGEVQGGALESSTVDIATEFSELLTYERSYQADSRVVTVSDDMTQDAVNLIK